MSPAPTAPKKPAAKPALKFGQPEKTDTKKTILIWSLVGLAVIGIIWMIAASPREKAMTCNGHGGALTGFGSCTTE